MNGSSSNNGAVIIVDVTDRENPVKRGNCPGTYSHDCFIKNDTVYAANIYNGKFSVIKAIDKDAPVMVLEFPYPTAVTHNIWTSDDRRWLLTTDEGGSNHLKIWNSQDLSNITLVYQYLPYQAAMVHNAYFKGDTIFMAHYRPVALMYQACLCTNCDCYDTYPDSGTAYQGAWNVYPYYSSGKFVVSDISSGLYVFKFTNSIGIHQIGTEIPGNYKLEQNYPNPFNPVTHFGFRIANFGLVQLKVFNILGEEVAVLVNEELKPGIYEESFDGSNLASGIYFYSLVTNGFKDSRKMVIAK